MIARLSDLWFDAQFITNTTVNGYYNTDSIEDADGLFLWCPCGYGRPEYPLAGSRPHGVTVSFANPRNGRRVPDNAGSHNRDKKPSRWTMSGDGFSNLTLSPSIDVTCWHGFIVDGDVR